MKKVNTYGLKMVGLKKAAGNTVNYEAHGMYDEIFYNVATGEVWTVFQNSLGHNFWTEYHDPDIKKICNTSKHMTMQEIANAIRETVCA